MWVVVVVVILVSAASMILFGRRRPPAVPMSLSGADSMQTIFVGVVVHPGEESDCARMLHGLFEKAAVAHRIRPGVLHYVSKEDRSPGGIGIAAYFANVRAQYDRICVEHDTRPHSFKVIRRNAEDDQGREVSRAEMRRVLFADEMFWCEAQPTHRFSDRWDTNAIECHAQAVGPNSLTPLLTVEPGDVFTHRATFPAVVAGDLDEHRFPQVVSKVFVEEPTKPYEVPLCSPSFVFGRSTVIRDVPPDPRFAFCDAADPLLRSARFATHGVRFFAPHLILVQRHRSSPIDSDPHRVLMPAKATTAKAQTIRIKAVHAALSVLGEDPCATCGRKRSEHTTAATLNHPFEPSAGALADRANLLGTAESLRAFRKRVGVWVNRRPNGLAAVGLVRGAKREDCDAKGYVKHTQPDADFA